MKITKAFLLVVVLLIAGSISSILTGCNRANAQSVSSRVGGPTNWIPVADSTFANINFFDAITAIAYGDGRFVAVGTNGKIAYCDW